jgi:hypothetical protein
MEDNSNMDHSTEKSTTKPNVLLVYILLGPPVGSLIASTVSPGGLPSIDFTAIFFSYFFFSPSATLAAFAYKYYAENIESKIPAHKLGGAFNYITNIIIGAFIGGSSTMAVFLVVTLFHQPIKSIIHPINLIGAAASAFCAFLLTGGPIERVSSTPEISINKK